MRKEVERCRLAFEQAAGGKDTGMICSGDAGVYGMSGVILEIGAEYPQVSVEIVPGVTAALSGGALLGAPLMHDFAVISLSDLMTPWELIAKRLEAAASADFSICIYNPSSKKRADYLQKACEILRKFRSGDTICGVVSNIGREGVSLPPAACSKARRQRSTSLRMGVVRNSLSGKCSFTKSTYTVYPTIT